MKWTKFFIIVVLVGALLIPALGIGYVVARSAYNDFVTARVDLTTIDGFWACVEKNKDNDPNNDDPRCKVVWGCGALTKHYPWLDFNMATRIEPHLIDDHKRSRVIADNALVAIIVSEGGAFYPNSGKTNVSEEEIESRVKNTKMSLNNWVVPCSPRKDDVPGVVGPGVQNFLDWLATNGSY